MLVRGYLSGVVVLMALSFLPVSNVVYSSDLDDGISKYRDEAIRGEDQALKTDKNINFIVLEAISNAKKNKESSTSNFNNGEGDNNENSIVVGPGSQVGDVINVIVGP